MTEAAADAAKANPKVPPAKGAAKPKGEKKEGGGRGRKARFTGMRIYLKVKENPRREGTHGHKSFALIKEGMAFEDYIKVGGRVGDLAWDVEKGSVVVK